jgi:hypothetical protein
MRRREFITFMAALLRGRLPGAGSSRIGCGRSVKLIGFPESDFLVRFSLF